MEQFHITEKQLREEFTLQRIIEISIYNGINNDHHKEEERKGKSRVVGNQIVSG